MFIPVLIFAIMLAVVPHDVCAKEKQTIVVDSKKKISYNDQQKLKKQLKKCKKAVDNKTKKEIYVCPK
jgi:hypothetical protein